MSEEELCKEGKKLLEAFRADNILGNSIKLTDHILNCEQCRNVQFRLSGYVNIGITEKLMERILKVWKRGVDKGLNMSDSPSEEDLAKIIEAMVAKDEEKVGIGDENGRKERTSRTGISIGH